MTLQDCREQLSYPVFYTPQEISATSYSQSDTSNQPYIWNSVKMFTGDEMNAEGVKVLCIH